MATGYVKLHRESMEHAVFEDEWLWKVFCWCIMRANFRTGQVQRGSFTTGRIDAADRLGASPSRVYRAFKRLQSLGCITVKSNNRFTTISVCNYGTYQSDDDDYRTTDEQQKNSQRTTDEQPANNEKTLIEEGKEGKKGKKGRSNTSPVTLDSVTFPSALDTPEVRSALAEWLEYKRIRGESYKAAWFVNHLLADFAAHGPLVFVQSVSTSIGRNYAGVFPPKGNQNGSSTASPRVGPGQRFQG